MPAESSMEQLEAWWKSNRPCKEVYGGTCNIRIGPPNWSHPINRYRDEPKSHPTPEQAMQAAQNPETATAVLERLAQWDPVRSPAIVDAARANLVSRPT